MAKGRYSRWFHEEIHSRQGLVERTKERVAAPAAIEPAGVERSSVLEGEVTAVPAQGGFG